MNLLFFVLAWLTTSALADLRVQLTPNVSIPLHYDIELTIDVASKSFTVEEAITVLVPQDTGVIEINSNELEVSWLSTRLVSEDGKEFIVKEFLELTPKNGIMLFFEETIPGKANYTLHISGVKGIFGAGLVEVPMSDNSTGNSSEMYLLSTGFNRTNLRSVFPCYDEPTYRSTFSFVIYHANGYNLITNAVEINTEGPIATKNHFMRSSYEITDLFSTTSIGFALTNMEVQSSEDNRVHVHHTDSETATVLLNNYHHLLLAVEQELQMPLELAQLGVIYVPTLPTRTLTKWGLILIGPEMIPVENSTIHAVELKDIQKEIARSVYQLFFGQLVHPQWWSDQWFTLGLSRYLAGVSEHLPFEAEKEFVVDTVQMVLRLHDLFTTRRMAAGYDNLDAINIVDVFAVDQRPAALMRLIANVMGRERFNEAIRDFLAAHRYSSVSDVDFLKHLDHYTEEDVVLPEGQSLSEVFLGFAYAYPSRELLRIVREQNNQIRILRWASELVELPVDFMTASIPSAGQPMFWLKRNSLEAKTIEIEDPWIVFNPQQYGVYAVEYDHPFYVDFARQLSANHTILNRAQLISDSMNQASRGILVVEHYLNLIRYLPKETDLITWRVVRITFEQMMLSMRGFDGDIQPLYNYYNNLTSALYLENRIGAEMEDFELTMELARIVCLAGLPECVQDVNDYFEAALESENGLVGSSDFQTLIYCTLAKDPENTEMLLNHTMSLWVADRRVHSQSRNAIRGLACTADKGAVKEFLDIAITDRLQIEDEIEQMNSERFFLLHTLMRGTEEAVMESLTYILNNFGAIQDLLHPINGLFHDLHHYVRTQEVVDVLDEIVVVHGERMDWRLRYDITGAAGRGYDLHMNNNRHVHANFRHWLANENEQGRANSP